MKPRCVGPRPCFAILVALSAGALAQAPEQGRFETSVREVVVDVVVHDSHGKLLKKLNAKDLTLYEDGVKRDIRSWRLVSGMEVRREEGPAAAKAANGAQPGPDHQPDLPRLSRHRTGQPRTGLPGGPRLSGQRTAPQHHHWRVLARRSRGPSHRQVHHQPRRVAPGHPAGVHWQGSHPEQLFAVVQRPGPRAEPRHSAASASAAGRRSTGEHHHRS